MSSVGFFWRGNVPQSQSLLGLTLRAEKALQLANQEAHRLDHNLLGTEHLLLGLIKEGVGLAAVLLKGIGCSLGGLRYQVCRSTAPLLAGVSLGRLECNLDLLNAIEIAVREAKDLNHAKVGTGHLLLGLISRSRAKGTEILAGTVESLVDFRAQVVTGLNYSNWAHVEDNCVYDDYYPPIELAIPPAT